MDDVIIVKAAHNMAMASVSRNWLKKLVAKPSPFDAPATRPAMSTNSM